MVSMGLDAELRRGARAAVLLPASGSMEAETVQDVDYQRRAVWGIDPPEKGKCITPTTIPTPKIKETQAQKAREAEL